MRKFAIIGLASVIALAAVAPAQALQGCGAGFHRGPHGRCVANVGTQVYVVGRYYPHHGYWYGHRWNHHRYMSHHHWRYR